MVSADTMCMWIIILANRIIGKISSVHHYKHLEFSGFNIIIKFLHKHRLDFVESWPAHMSHSMYLLSLQARCITVMILRLCIDDVYVNSIGTQELYLNVCIKYVYVENPFPWLSSLAGCNTRYPDGFGDSFTSLRRTSHSTIVRGLELQTELNLRLPHGCD